MVEELSVAALLCILRKQGEATPRVRPIPDTVHLSAVRLKHAVCRLVNPVGIPSSPQWIEDLHKLYAST
jgi:hypothetical protein